MGDRGLYVTYINKEGELCHGKSLHKDQTTELAKLNLVAVYLMNNDYSKHLFDAQGKLRRVLVKANKLTITGYIN